MSRSHVLLDGLQEPAAAQALSRAWSAAGFDNTVDAAGQHATLADRDHPDSPLSPQRMADAAAVARPWGLEIRDRAGRSYHPGIELPALRKHLAYEYRARLATALMFGLPALALHWFGPILSGTDGRPQSMALPWLMQMLLVGWVALAAGWPILWQGTLAMAHARVTADTLVTAVFLLAFVPSAYGVVSMGFVTEPWFAAPPRDAGPMFHAALLVLLVTIVQRWLLHRHAPQLAGRGRYLLRGWHRFVSLWLLLTLACLPIGGWTWAPALGMLLPCSAALGAIGARPMGWSVILPPVGFALFLVFAPGALDLDVTGVEAEIAAGFVLMMTASFAWGWRALAVGPGATNPIARA